MKRFVYEELLEWKNRKQRKPLIVDGARQVGKTWILKEFGKCEFKHTVYINCDQNADAKKLFYDYDTDRLFRGFSALSSKPVIEGETLIILDEIQEIPAAITSLKYFAEDKPGYHIAAAGSLLGISLHEGSGFPVGKVERVKMYPMTFYEFLTALGKDQLILLIESGRWEETASFSTLLTDLLRQYYYVGGMPGVVRSYVEENDLMKVRKIQKRIIDDYEEDFSRHIPPLLLSKVRMIWSSIPAQLAKENKKFIYGAVKKGARAKEFEDAIEWLKNAGLIYKVHRIRKIERPLEFYEAFDIFKIFLLDLGLLGAMTGTTAKEVLVGGEFFSGYKGAFTEQYVQEELVSGGVEPYYYSKDNSTLEIDFVIQSEELYAIEVKAEENVKSKSLKTVHENNSSVKGVRFSMLDYKAQDWMTNVPLYGVGAWLKNCWKMCSSSNIAAASETV